MLLLKDFQHHLVQDDWHFEVVIHSKGRTPDVLNQEQRTRKNPVPPRPRKFVHSSLTRYKARALVFLVFFWTIFIFYIGKCEIPNSNENCPSPCEKKRTSHYKAYQMPSRYISKFRIPITQQCLRVLQSNTIKSPTDAAARVLFLFLNCSYMSSI